MVKLETTFEELRGLKAITQACLNATVQKGWKNLGEMMRDTGTVAVLYNVFFQKKRVRSELVDALDRLPTMDRALADYLLIEWARFEAVEERFDRMAAQDAIGREVKRCFHRAWELRTLAIYDQSVWDERLSAYPPLTQKQLLEWAIDCLNALEADAWGIFSCCSHLSGFSEAAMALQKLSRRFSLVHERKPFPEWDAFVRFEFEQLTYDVRVSWLQTAARDPSFVNQVVNCVYLPEKAFLERMERLMTHRHAEIVWDRCIPELIDIMSDWERAPREKQLAFMASHIMWVNLSEQEVGVLYELWERLGYMPLFFLACAKFRNNNHDQDYVFAVSNGIIEDQGNRLADIQADKFYSEWMIKSWSKGKIRDFTIRELNDWDWSVYPALNEAFFWFEDDPIWERIRTEERVSTTFEGFGALLALTHGLVMERVKGRRLLVNPRKLPGFRVAAYAKELDRVLGGSYTETVQLDLRALAGEAEAPLPLDQLIRLTSWLTGRECPTGTLVLSRNHVDVVQVFARYLKERGEPMHKQELLGRFRAEYPDLPLSDTALLGTLRGNPRFWPRKITGFYALSEWQSRFHRSMGDLAEELLREAGVPLSVEALYEQVVKEFKNTSPRSLEGCLRLDARKRFVKLPDKRIGLA